MKHRKLYVKTTPNSELLIDQLEQVCGGDNIPVEDFSLNFEEIKGTYLRETLHSKWRD